MQNLEKFLEENRAIKKVVIDVDRYYDKVEIAFTEANGLTTAAAASTFSEAFSDVATLFTKSSEMCEIEDDCPTPEIRQDIADEILDEYGL